MTSSDLPPKSMEQAQSCYSVVQVRAMAATLNFAGYKELAKELRMELARRVKLRHVPELHFHYDDSVDRGERIETLLRENPPGAADE